jgi:exonuclease SbcC
MIISRVQITNYKQYAGDHDITIPSAATIGVIGANGVGKTTLFEAIEWALYGTGVAATKDIRPRGRAGNTQVSVTLDLPASAEQFIVERELRKSSTRAIVYKVEPDGEEAIVVQGAGPVTTYVANTLIGLDYKAFTATFFTRQKELSFFGDLGESARRREVGKLLGLETIRLAQQKIGEDRTRARNEATVLEKQYETQATGHDFPAEIAAAEETIKASKESLAVANKDVDAATERVAVLEKDATAQQELKDRDSTVATKILELRGQHHAATQQRDNATTELQRLDARAKERDALSETASALESLQQQMASLDQQRERFQRRQQIQQSILASEKRRGDVISALRSTVLGITPPSPIDGWKWSNGDHEDPASAATRYIAVLDRVDISAEERREQAYQRLRSIAKERAEALDTLRTYETTRQNLEESLNALLIQGHPAPKLQAAQARMQEIQKQDANLAAELAQIAAEDQPPRDEPAQGGHERAVPNLRTPV